MSNNCQRNALIFPLSLYIIMFMYLQFIHYIFFLYFFINIKYLSYSKELMLNIQKPHKIGFCEHLKTDTSLNFFLNEINLADLRNPVFR